MPRISNGRPLSAVTSSRPPKRKSTKNQSLNALAVAERQNPTKSKVRHNRLGEIEDDGDRRAGHSYDAQAGDGRSAKRRKTDLNNDSSDQENVGSDGDGSQWHEGVDDEDEDSDLDSDDAMGASDEEKFEGFTFRGSASGPVKAKARPDITVRKRTEIDLLEDGDDGLTSASDNEDEDNLGDEAVDLATALDLNEEDERFEERARSRKKRQIKSSSNDRVNENDSVSGEDDSDDEAVSELSFSTDDGEDITGHSRLRTFIQDLGEQDSESAQPRKRSTFFNVPDQPSEFAIKPSTKLTVADLLPTVTDPRLRRSLKMLRNEEQRGPESYEGGIPGRLAPPLAKRQQDRLDRVAAYDKSKETLNRWVDTVKQNRRAEHLSFPLPDPDAPSILGTRELAPTSQSEPLTALESAIRNIMQESGLTSKDGESMEDRVQAFEELEGKKLPFEEMQARRAELRRARDLLFREETRARHIKKIKSKAYRRVHRKERNKIAEEERTALAAAGVLNSDEEREQNDRRRAEERMGSRHKESRWAKGVKAAGRTVWDEDVRSGMTDLARKDEELRKRIQGKNVATSDQSSSEPSESDSDDDMPSSSHKHRGNGIRDELERLDATEIVEEPSSKLGAMAFMQKAEASRKAANYAEIQQIRRDLDGGVAETQDDVPQDSSGRMKFGVREKAQAQMPFTQAMRGEFEERLSDDEYDGEQQLKSTDDEVNFILDEPRTVNKVKTKRIVKHQLQAHEGSTRLQPDISDNPWLCGSSKSKAKVLNDEATISANPSIFHQKQVSTGINGMLPQPETLNRISHAAADVSSRSESEEPLTPVALLEYVPTRNEELVRMAFSGDDVFRDFAKEKKETIDDEGDQVVDSTLPGWGSWTGSGISKREQKRAKGRLMTTVKGVAPERRKDAKLDKVIVNEKRVKKNAKYLAPELPHPFESRQQYERSLRLPLGPEWTTKKTFQDTTKPRVLVKQGVIRPMERPLA